MQRLKRLAILCLAVLEIASTTFQYLPIQAESSTGFIANVRDTIGTLQDTTSSGPIKQDQSSTIIKNSDGDSKSSSTLLDTTVKKEEEKSDISDAGLQSSADKLAEETLLKTLKSNEKDAYTVIKNKYMSQDEVRAFEWNLVISQFAVPYSQSIQDALDDTAFKDMSEKGLVIETNTYIKAMGLEALTTKINAGLSMYSDFTIDFKTVSDTLKENGKVTYSPLCNRSGENVYITDLFKEDCLFIQDNMAIAGEVSGSSTWEKLNSFNEKYGNASAEEIVKAIQSNNQITNIQLPVYIQTDSVQLYNCIFVANAIRMGSYGSYSKFIESIGNSQLFVDRWGNICANLTINNTNKYVVVYPAYANPLWISTGLSDDDYAGVIYENLSDKGMWNYNKDSILTVSDSYVQKTLKQIKERIQSSDEIDKKLDWFLGSYNDDSGSFGSAFRQETVLDEKQIPVSNNVYARKDNKAYGIFDRIPTILLADTTTNFVFNKAILSAYTRQDITNSNQSKDNWYSCLSERLSTYEKIKDTESYSPNSNSGFRNSIVFDKYYPQVSVKLSGDIAKEKLRALQISSLVINLNNWSTSKTSTPTSGTKLTGKLNGLKIKAIGSSADSYTLYPFYLMNSYRKELYNSGSGTSLVDQLTDVNPFGDNVSPWIHLTNKQVSSSWNKENLLATEKDDTKYVPQELLWNAMFTDSDRFKTYVTLNYEKSELPINSSMYQIANGRLSQSDLGAEYVENIKDKKISRTYVSFPLLDGVLDMCNEWDIWAGDGIDYSMSAKKVRDRKSLVYNTKDVDGFFYSKTCQ